MAPIIPIEDIARHVGEEVTLHGWLYDKTGKGKLQGILRACLVFTNVH